MQPIEQQLETERLDLTDRLERIHSDRRRVAGPLPKDFAEQAVEIENDEVLDALELSLQQRLRDVTQALGRIGDDSYGLCVLCHQTIDSARLAALPTTGSCRDCADDAH